MMSKGGVSPRTAQAAMRHSKLDLTMNVYTDPKLLDVRGALDVLPTLPLDVGFGVPEAARATGTAGGELLQSILPTILNEYKPGQSEGIAGKVNTGGERSEWADAIAANGTAGKAKGPLTSVVNGPSRMGATGLEPVTPSVSSYD
jgi:hypothetical protein